MVSWRPADLASLTSSVISARPSTNENARSLLSRLSSAISRFSVNRENEATEPDTSQSTTISGRGGRPGSVPIRNGTPPVPIARCSVRLMLSLRFRNSCWARILLSRCAMRPDRGHHRLQLGRRCAGDVHVLGQPDPHRPGYRRGAAIGDQGAPDRGPQLRAERVDGAVGGRPVEPFPDRAATPTASLRQLRRRRHPAPAAPAPSPSPAPPPGSPAAQSRMASRFAASFTAIWANTPATGAPGSSAGEPPDVLVGQQPLDGRVPGLDGRAQRGLQLGVGHAGGELVAGTPFPKNKARTAG